LLVNCKDCTESEPVDADLEIKLDIANYGKAILIKVYEGNLEDSVLYKTLYAAGTGMTITVSVNKLYTVTASYYMPHDIYITVDSATPKVKYSKDQCDNPCYYVYDKKLDLRLKYY
jgi:hypothetical protein